MGVTSFAQEIRFTGTCDTHRTSLVIEQGNLLIDHDFTRYHITLPQNVDHAWLVYRFGDEYAWLGNCHPLQHPFDDTFCRGIMTKILAIGWY
jgi:hypothetical protein